MSITKEEMVREGARERVGNLKDEKKIYAPDCFEKEKKVLYTLSILVKMKRKRKKEKLGETCVIDINRQSVPLREMLPTTCRP